MNWLALLNALLPTAAQIILMIRHQDGTVTATVYLDQADAANQGTIDAVNAWLAAKGKPAA